MSEKQFPTYRELRDCRCFNCGAELWELGPSGHAPGAGDFRGFCRECEMFTWFNFKPERGNA